MPVKLLTAGGGGVNLTPASSIASDVTVNVPSVASTLLNDSAGVMNIGSGQIYKDANGNVGIGTSSPVGRVTIEGTLSAAGILNALTLRNAGDGGVGLYFDNSVSNNLASIEARVASTGAGTDDGILVFSTASDGTNTERARIDNVGRLMVRTTAAPTGIWNTNAYVNIQAGVQLTHTGNANIWRQISWSGDTTDATLFFPGGSSLGTTANVASLSSAGTWINASDGRQKENVRDIKYGLSTVLDLKPRSYTRIDTAGEFIGFVAQELKTAIPEVVLGSEQTSYGVDYGSLVAVAFKAIQEQQAIIQTLTARIEALEAK